MTCRPCLANAIRRNEMAIAQGESLITELRRATHSPLMPGNTRSYLFKFIETVKEEVRNCQILLDKQIEQREAEQFQEDLKIQALAFANAYKGDPNV